MKLVRGVVQHYSWGDPASIPQLLGLEADGRPWAELWFGTHLGGPGKVIDLDETGQRGPTPTLSDDTGGLFSPLTSVSGELPFLLKVLAAAEPLSLQSHPSQEQARIGYARENRLDIPIGNSRRIYRDPFAKPELICALEPFEALCGFRREVDSIRLLHSIGGSASHLARLITDHDLGHALRYLFGGTEEIRVLQNEIIDSCREHDSVSARWAVRLDHAYPDDPAVIVTLLMNHVTLERGEALYLGPGNLHAYLRGTGVEVMGSSDNVVRCGLTNKHVDVNELLATVVPEPLPDPIVRATPVARTGAGRLWRYVTPEAPFALWVHQIDGTETIRARTRELTLCGVGSTDLLQRGEVAYLSPGEELTLRGKATLFRVTEWTDPRI
jgi:mannose-6-phosphate isomerase